MDLSPVYQMFRIYGSGSLMLSLFSRPVYYNSTFKEELCDLFPDDFVTPDSTPPNEPSPSDDSGLTPSASASELKASQQQNLSDMVRDMSLSDVHDKIYDKYTLDLSDLQVRAK